MEEIEKIKQSLLSDIDARLEKHFEQRDQNRLDSALYSQ